VLTRTLVRPGGGGYLPSICHMDAYLQVAASAALPGRGGSEDGVGEMPRMGQKSRPAVA
jgi:hypothetical protein